MASINSHAKNPSNFDVAFKQSISPLVDASKDTIYSCRLDEYHSLYGYIGNRYLNVIWPDKNRNLTLRSQPKNIEWEDYKRSIYQYNMHDSRLNNNGCFRNSLLRLGYVDEHVNRVRFLDRATDLMWLIPDHNRQDYSYQSAQRQLKTINNTSIDDHNDWRLPTIEEAASLYRRRYSTETGSETLKKYYYWTSDRLGDKAWASLHTFSSVTDLTWTHTKNPRYGKPVEYGLVLVRSQHQPYPQKYLTTLAQYENEPYQEQQCKHWERYRGNNNVVRTPESPEWPTIINAKNLRTKPMRFIGTEHISKDKNSLTTPVSNGNWRCFRNYFIDTKKGVVIDLATNLMWQKASNIALNKYEKVRDKNTYVDALNNDNFAGENSWRVPTQQEMLSLMESTAFRNNPNLKVRTHLDSIFDQQVQRYMVADSFQPKDTTSQRHVVIDFDATRVDTSLYVKPEKPAYDTVKAVRSLSRKEIQSYCQQIKGLTCQ